MDRAILIDEALAKRDFAPGLRERIERLIDGEDDRTRLHCCSSGCFVCVLELLAIVREVEAQLAEGAGAVLAAAGAALPSASRGEGSSACPCPGPSSTAVR